MCRLNWWLFPWASLNKYLSSIFQAYKSLERPYRIKLPYDMKMKKETFKWKMFSRASWIDSGHLASICALFTNTSDEIVPCSISFEIAPKKYFHKMEGNHFFQSSSLSHFNFEKKIEFHYYINAKCSKICPLAHVVPLHPWSSKPESYNIPPVFKIQL